MGRGDQTSQYGLLLERIEALRDCLAAQHKAVAQGDLDTASQRVEEFAQIAASLDVLVPPDPASPASGRVLARLEEVAGQHERLLTGLRVAQREVQDRLQQLQRRRPALTAYGRQAAAAGSMGEEGLLHVRFGFDVGH